MMRTTDRIRLRPGEPQRLTLDDLLKGFEHATGRLAPEKVRRFATRLYVLCERYRIDAAYAFAHAMNECDWGKDSDFTEDNNAFGIGNTDGSGGVVFPSPDACAEFYVTEVLIKLRANIDAERQATRAFAPDKFDRVAWLVTSGALPTVTTIDDLNNPFGDNDFVWMEDPNGPGAIVAKGRAMWPELSDQSTEGSTVPGTIDVVFERALIGRTKAALTRRDAFITVHNTGNNVSRYAERTFFAGGGGAQGVLVHFIVDAGGILQITPLWSQGVHAGNVEGNLTSIAIEARQAGDDPNLVEQNVAKLLAMIVNRDPQIDWTGAEGFVFSLDRVKGHGDWPGANPACPALFRARHGDDAIPLLVRTARTYLATPTPAPKVTPHPVGGEADGTGRTHMDDNGNLWLYTNKMFFAERPVQAYEYANVVSRKGPLYPGGKRIRAVYVVAAEGPEGIPELWATTRQGWRFRLEDVAA